MSMAHTELLDAWQPTVIKGNAAEIGALADWDEVCTHKSTISPARTLKTDSCFLLKVKGQGVDSLGSFENAPQVVRSLARTYRS